MKKKAVFAYLASLEKRGIVLGLSRIRRFLRLLGNPEKNFRSIHIAGSKGKGSTAAMVESILRCAGYKTAFYTSPHLVRINERFLVNGKEISDKKLVHLISRLAALQKKSKIKLTHFEFLAALAFEHFSKSRVDFAVIEVGMGGRLDATNVITPCVSVITKIEKEHSEILGNTIEKIAREKAGIVKQGVPLVTAEKNKKILRLFSKICRKRHSKLVVVKKPFTGRLSLKGSFQKWNAAAALAVVRELQSQGFDIGESAIIRGFAKTKWPGRFQIVQNNPTVVLDCCHTPYSAQALQKAFAEIFPGKKTVLVIGVSSDKDIKAIAKQLSKITLFAFACEARSQRAMPAKKIAEVFAVQGIESKVVLDVKKALNAAMNLAGKREIVLVAGSCFVVGEAMPRWQRKLF